jgi:sterol desaturase/sphingolipid hydroxylase (fatty acid hydroxylase superfamily)
MNSESAPVTESSASELDASRKGYILPVALRRPFNVSRDWLSHLATTRFNSLAGLGADAAISLVLLCAGLWHTSATPSAAFLIVSTGLVLFSFVEYCFHRWLFHGAAHAMEQGHRKHHEQPMGYDALPFFLPPLGMLVLAALLTLVLPGSYAFLLAGGLAAGYAAYGLSHCAIHYMRFRNPLSRRWAASHHIHHRHPEKNFGVTTPLWDIVLGTRYVSAAKAPKPRDLLAGNAER